MTRCGKKHAFTITEMLVVIVILAVLMTLVLKVGKRIKDQADEKAAGSTIDIIVAAIEEYQSHHDRFPVVTIDLRPSSPRGGYTEFELGTDILLSLRGNNISFTPLPYPDPYDYSCEGMYYFLSRDADCVSTMKSISDKYVTNKNEDGIEVFVTVEVLDINGDIKTTKIIELRRFVDPWGNSYRYRYRFGYSFPVLESAGKDGDFLTVADNISSR